MPYSKPWGSTTPGCVIFLLDRSGSMSGTFGSGSVAEGQRLDTAVATQINRCINELARQSLKGELLSPRVEIAVIGYGGNKLGSVLQGELDGREIVGIVELMQKPLRIEKRTRKIMDDSGELQTYDVPFPVWVDATSEGGTPMCGAIDYAYKLAAEWIESHSHCFPPLVINITDGVATDGDPRDVASMLRGLSTDDGNLLLFNCHISALPGQELKYPSMGTPLPPDENESAQKLFDMSSEIPAPMRILAKELVDASIAEGARGFLFNADVSTVSSMLQFSTQVREQVEPDPNM